MRRLLALCLVALCIAAASAARGAPKARSAPNSAVEEEIDTGSTFKPKAKKKISKKRDQASIAELNSELGLIEEKIAVTKAQIGKVRDASYLPDLYFALADMYVQKARVLYFLKSARHPEKNPDEIDFTVEKRPKLEAIEIYQKIYSFFPKEKRRDKALFLQGLEQRDLGQMEQMIRTFNQLSSEFPNSEHFNEANIILADFFFEVKRDVDVALEILKRVTSGPLSPFTPLAFYRMGWCHMNKGQPDEAVKSYEQALDTQRMVDPNALPDSYRRTDISREAVLALAVPYVDIYTDPQQKYGQVGEPVEYFRNKSPDHFTFRRVLARAGRRLVIKEDWRSAAESFFHVASLSVEFDARFEAIQRVNDAHKRKASKIDFLGFVKEIGVTIDVLQAAQEKPIAFDEEALTTLEKKADEMENSSAGSDKKRARSAKAAADLKKSINYLKFLETVLRDFATRLHKKARTTGSPHDFAQAAEAYDIYLERFPRAPKAFDMRFNIAETLFKGGKLVRAGMAYEYLASEPRLRAKAGLFQESAIEAYTKALASIETLTAVEKIRARRGLRSIGAEWLKSNPKAKGAPTAAFNIANSWYEERILKKAIDEFKSYIQKYPKAENVRDAIFLVMNSYSQLDDYKGLQAAGEQLGKTPGLADADRQMIREAVRRAQSKQLQTIAGEFGTKEYAENLLAAANKYKGSSLGVQALYEAFTSLKSKRDPEMFEVGEALIDQHSDSQYAKEVASTMATLALNTASFDRAAKYLARFADRYPQEKEAVEFRKTSAALYERQGDFKKARTQYAALAEKRAVARMDLALNDWSGLEKSSGEAQQPESKYWRALAIWRQKRFQDAAPLLNELVADAATPADQSGHAKFLLAQLSLERFRSIQMKSAEDQQSLLDKVKAFQALSAELGGLIKSGSGKWPIAGLYLLGQTHFDLGRFIADSPLPAGLSEEDKKTYIAELNKQASTYIAESEKVFGKCIEAAQENDVFTRYVDGCRSKGQKVVREEDDMVRAQAKSLGSEPPVAHAVRKRLINEPRNVQLLFELGEIYVRADQPLNASGIFSRILELDADNSRAIASIGVCSLYMNDFDAAYGAFKHALKLNSSDPTALWNLAGLYKQFEFNEKMKATIEKTAQMKPPSLRHPSARGL